MKVWVYPQFDAADKGDGGIRRVVEAQMMHLPRLGVEVVMDGREADIVAAHVYTPSGPLANTRTKVIVSHNHGLYWTGYDWQKSLADFNYDIIEAMDRADAVTAPSDWVGRILSRQLLRGVTTLYHGVDAAEWEPIEPAQPLYVLWNKTRLDPVCDVTPLNVMANALPDQKFVSTFGATLPNMYLTGAMSWADQKDVVRQAGVYLATSRETFGIGTIEAMAAGVPVLGWNWGGQKEIVEHGITGWLCTPGDVDGLLAGLDWCLANRAKAGKAARDTVLERFTWERAMERYVKLYTQLLDARHPYAGTTLASPGVQSPGTQPRATIVIPCYKLERFLDEAIKSTHVVPNAEVLVVDDCSPGDGSASSAQEIAEANGATYVRTPENLYLAGALNYGIERAQGPIIIALDADNTLGDAADELVKAIETRRDVDIAYGAMYVLVYEEDGTTVGREYKADWPVEFSFPRQITGYNQIPSTAAFRKEIWTRVGGYRRRCRTADDADFWCRATSFGGRAVRVTDGITLNYRDRLDSMSHTETAWQFADWYGWSRKKGLTPWGASLSRQQREQVLTFPTFEPTKVSIIVPVGPGHARYLPDLIDSVLSQTMQDWELIIVNDSGEDLGWTPPIATYLQTTESGRGPAVARNMGLARASGSAFMFLDADDYLQPTALEWLWTAYAERNHAHFVYGDYIEQPGGSVHACPDYTPTMFMRMSPIPVTFLAPMKWVKDGSLLFDESLSGWEDWDFFLRMCELGICGTHVTVPVFNYRVNTGMRREALYARRDELKEEVLNKWSQYISGEKEMGCGACGASNWRIPAPPAEQQTQDQQAAPSGETVRLEFLGKSGTMTYNGKATRRAYRFGDSSGHRVNIVDKVDAQAFIEIWPNLFRLYDTENIAPAAAINLLTPAG